MTFMFSSASALKLSNQLNDSYKSIMETSQRLASGTRLNSSSDGAADIAIADNFKIQNAEIDIAVRNGQDGMALLQVTDTDLAAVEEYLSTALEKMQKADNGLLTKDEVLAYVSEAQAMLDATQNLSNSSSYKDDKLLDGTKGSVTIEMSNQDVVASSSIFGDVDFSGSITVNSADNLSDILTDVQTDITTLLANLDTVNSRRSSAGTTMSQIDNATSSLLKQKEGYVATESTIRDADVANESAKQIKSQVLYQTASSLFAEMTEGAKSRAISIISSAGIY